MYFLICIAISYVRINKAGDLNVYSALYLWERMSGPIREAIFNLNARAKKLRSPVDEIYVLAIYVIQSWRENSQWSRRGVLGKNFDNWFCTSIG